MSDVEMREELKALELLLSRDALWVPVRQSFAVDNNRELFDFTVDPRPRFEARRDELRAALSETKVTMLAGYVVLGGEDDAVLMGKQDNETDVIGLSDLLPDTDDEDKLFDWEITVTRRPHLAQAKKVEEA